MGFLNSDSIFLLHFTSTACMTGVIWTIQLVHYPSFHMVSRDQFHDFTQFHNKRISLIVMPLMLLELFTALALSLTAGTASMHLNLLGVIAIWASTFLLSVPCHNKLQSGPDTQTIQRLVRTNWPRTLIWTARTVGLLYYLLNQ